MDLWRESLPEFDGAALEAKYARQAAGAFNDPSATPSPSSSAWRSASRSPSAC